MNKTTYLAALTLTLAVCVGVAGAQYPEPTRVVIMPVAAAAYPSGTAPSAPAAVVLPPGQPGCGPYACPCGHPCGCARACNIRCLIPWACEDLVLKPVEPCPSYCGCGWFYNLLWCPPKANGNGNGGNGDKQNSNGASSEANGEKKNGNAANGNGAEAEEEPPTPLMSVIQCYHPGLFDHLTCNGTKVYGWIQQGYTFNFDSPDNRNNFGVNFNNRSNDYMLNQVWLRLERALAHEHEFTWGYTIDVNFGQDAADFNVLSLGMWENFTGDADVAVADDEDYGLDLPQFYVEAHFPGLLTERGVDVRVGRFVTLHGNELSPAIQTNFYSHSYGYFYSWPLTHTGVLATLHLTDTVDWMNGLVLGWDNVFSDNNDKLSWHGMVIWTACDKRSSFWVTYTLGPEGVGRLDSRNDSYRFLITYDYSRKFGACDQWQLVLHGANAWDHNVPTTGEDVEWYDYAANLFYTIDPRLILGARAEWFRDDDGFRTGFADSFYEVTLGVTYKPYQNLWIRPEFRVDWADETRPFNDGRDKRQYTAAMDVIWQY